MEIIVEIVNKQISNTFKTTPIEKQLIEKFKIQLPFITNLQVAEALKESNFLSVETLAKIIEGDYHPLDKFDNGCSGTILILKYIPEDKLADFADLVSATWNKILRKTNINPVSSTAVISINDIILQNAIISIKTYNDNIKPLELSDPSDRIMINGKVYILNAVMDDSGTNIVDTANKEINSKFRNSQIELGNALKSFSDNERRKLQDKLAQIQSGILVPNIVDGLIKKGIQVQIIDSHLAIFFPFHYTPKFVYENDKTYTIPPRLASSLARKGTVRFILNNNSGYQMLSCELYNLNLSQLHHYHQDCWGTHKFPIFSTIEEILSEVRKLEKLLEVIDAHSLAIPDPTGFPKFLSVRNAAKKYTEEKLAEEGKKVAKGWSL